MKFSGFTKILVCVWVLWAHNSLFAQDNQRKALTSKPIASVNLNKSEFLTGQRFSEELNGIEMITRTKLPAEGRLQLREKMIDNMIVLQAAERDKIKPSDSDILELLRRQVNQPTASLNDLKKMYENSEASKFQKWDDLMKRLKDESIINNYYRKNIPRDSIKTPTDEEIRKAYNEHKSSFVMPTTVRISHIFFSFGQDKTSAEKAVAKDKAEKTLAELNSGRATFEEIVRKYSEDRDSSVRLGDLGYITDTPQARQFLGDEFMNTVVRLRAGQTSGVVASREGYHIVRITEKQNKKQLALADPNPADPRSTVYQLVEQQLMEMEYGKKIQDLVKKLRSQAKITINEDAWKPWIAEVSATPKK